MPSRQALRAIFEVFGMTRPNKGRFYNNSEIDTLISKRLSVENKAKLSQLETARADKVIICREQSENLSTGNIKGRQSDYL